MRIVAVLIILLSAVFAPPAEAQAEGRAGLVVVHGDGRHAFVLVRFEGESIRAVDLLGRSGLEVSELSFGALGMGVCEIEGTGCDIATCRSRVCQGPKPDDPYWKLFIRTDEGSWQAAPLGISSASLADGAVQALVWTGTDPEIPAYSIDEIAAKAGAPGENGVALSRYDASGDKITGENTDESSLPVAGLAAVGLAAALAVVLVVKRQAISR